MSSPALVKGPERESRAAQDPLTGRGRGLFRFLYFPAGTVTALLLLVLAWLAVVPVGAVPYASNLTNAQGVISFRLNAGADRVWLVWDGGQMTNDLGAFDAGLHQVTAEITGPFQVAVFKVAPPSYGSFRGTREVERLPLRAETHPNARFFSPRGIAVNSDPASPWFGRVYVANSQAGMVTNDAFGPERLTEDGLYALNSDLTDAVGQGDNARTCGLYMTNSERAPYRLSLGRAGELYVCDASESSGNLYSVDGDLVTGTIVLGGVAGGGFPVGVDRVHGRILAAVVSGALAQEGLTAFVIDQDLQSQPDSTLRLMLNSLWRHDVGYNLPAQWAFPTLVVEAPWFNLAAQIMDLSRGTNGYFYVNNYRTRGLDRGGLYVHDQAGSALWNSFDATREFLNDSAASDFLAGTGGGTVSDDGQFAAVMNQDNGVVTVLPLVNGIPDLVQRMTFETFSQTNGVACDLAFDAAGNIYAFSSTAQAVQAFSPGGVTTAITGSDGTFRVLRPPQLSVTTKPFAVEGDVTAGFVVRRTGDTNVEVSVRFQFEGTATLPTDYQQTNAALTALLPAGVVELAMPFEPLPDDLTEEPESVICTLLSGADYDLVYPASATCWILDPPVLSVSVLDSNAYERFSEDHLVFEIQRDGETNSEVQIHYDLAGGSAVSGLDFGYANDEPLPGLLRLAPGQTRLLFALAPHDDADLEGAESVTPRLLPGELYRLGEASEATGWILDDETPPLPGTSVLFRDDLDQDTSRDWVVQFGANNDIYDASVIWAFDYGLLGIPPAPHTASGSRVGLLLQLNNTNDTEGGSAGINLYPRDRFFAGDFALCFDVFITAGFVAPTEHLLGGLNHSALFTNRVTRSPDPNGTTRGGDGVWFALSNDGSDELPFAIYTVPAPDTFPELLTNEPSAAFTEVFPSPPYRHKGVPAGSGLDCSSNAWTEVELRQIQDVISLKLNNRLIVSLTNTTGFTNGNIMIGWNDQFDSIGSTGFHGSYLVIDNVRVLNYEPVLRGLTFLNPDQVALDFVVPGAESVQQVQVQVSPELPASTWQDLPAVVTSTPGGFRAVFPRVDEPQFFRVRRN